MYVCMTTGGYSWIWPTQFQQYFSKAFV